MKEKDVIYKSQLLNWQIISKNRNLLFGIAILMVMLRHNLEMPGIASWIGFKKNSLLFVLFEVIHRSAVGVDIFLFLSGVGLYYSFSKCSNLKKFYFKRFYRVLVPYLIIGTSSWIFRDMVYTQNSQGIFDDIFWITFYSEGKTTYWYILFILIMYLLYPLIYYMLESRYRNINFVILLSAAFTIIYLLYTRDYETYKNIEIALARTPIFIVGCYWGKLVKSAKPMHDFWIVYALIVLFIGGIFQYISKQGGLPWKVSSRLWYGMVAIGICILFSLLLSITTLGVIGKLLNFAGTISLELYLFHIALKDALRISHPECIKWGMGKSLFWYVIVAIIGCFLLAFIYHILSQIVSRKLKEIFVGRKI